MCVCGGGGQGGCARPCQCVLGGGGGDVAARPRVCVCVCVCIIVCVSVCARALARRCGIPCVYRSALVRVSAAMADENFNLTNSN